MQLECEPRYSYSNLDTLSTGAGCSPWWGLGHGQGQEGGDRGGGGKEHASSLLTYAFKDMNNRTTVLGIASLVHNNFLTIPELGCPG